MKGTSSPGGAEAGTIPVRWTARAVPLVPAAVIAEGAAALPLLRRVLDHPDAELADWAGVIAPAGLVALLTLRPDSAPLPWADGVRYLGRDAGPGGATAPVPLLVPTDLAPSVPVALLHRALRLRFPDVPEPLAVWPSGTAALRILSLYEARGLERAVVAAAHARLASSPAGAPREGTS